MKTTIVGIGAALVALTACGGASGEAASPSSASPSPSAPPYATIEDLQRAFVQAGRVCEDPKPEDTVTTALDAVRCGFRGEVLLRYSGTDVPKGDAEATLKSMKEDNIDGGVAYGPGWLIAMPDSKAVPEVAAALGGEHVVNAIPGALIARTRLEFALAECKVPLEDDVAVGDAGLTLTLDGTVPYETAECVLSALDVPDSVTSRIGQTRALDGMQEAQWGTVEAVWTYHPDDGLNLILTSTD
jgi:hypothetical protein